jgi:hygromycin-B 4-O-kinase
MSAIKPVVDEAPMLALLEEQFGAPVTGLRVLEGGSVAQSFTFDAGGGSYVIRFNGDNLDASYEKEAYVTAKYASSRVPIPGMIRVGRLGTLNYAITVKIAGERLDRLAAAESERVQPSVVDTLNAIHASDVSHEEGFGVFDNRGVGFFPSWAADLASVRDEERADGFFGKWHSMFETTFLERAMFDRVYARMESLLEYCPTERYLVHGGFGFGNVLVANDRVVAVIDWLDARYGDFLYDVAWLDYWEPGRYRELFRRDYAARGVDVPNFDRRLLCYHCRMALDGMRFFAKAGRPDAYKWTCDRITSLLAA